MQKYMILCILNQQIVQLKKSWRISKQIFMFVQKLKRKKSRKGTEEKKRMQNRY